MGRPNDLTDPSPLRGTVTFGVTNPRLHLLNQAMTPSEVAKRLHITTAEVIAAIDSGELPSLRISGVVRVPSLALAEVLCGDWPPESERKSSPSFAMSNDR